MWWPFGKKKDVAAQLRSQARDVAELVSEAFNTPGHMYNEQRAQAVGGWLTKFEQALENAGRTAFAGKDKPDVVRQVKRTVKTLCEESGKPEYLKRLEGVCGASMRNRFERILRELRAVYR